MNCKIDFACQSSHIFKKAVRGHSWNFVIDYESVAHGQSICQGQCIWDAMNSYVIDTLL